MAATLASLAAQIGIAPASLDILVVDNDDAPTARAITLSFAETSPYPVRYVHAPAGNISIARNACLDHSDREWIAFIDDDEVADPSWLLSLLREAQSENADIVVGPVIAEYPSDCPDWIAKGDFLSIRGRTPGTLAKNAYCGNALIRRALVVRCGARFDLSYGRSGGEDTAFFALLNAGGGRFAASPGAVVREVPQRERLRLGYLLRRSWRNGHTFGSIHRDTALGATLGKVLILLGLCVMRAAHPIAWRRHLLRILFHVGVVAGRLGLSPPKMYGATVSDHRPRLRNVPSSI